MLPAKIFRCIPDWYDENSKDSNLMVEIGEDEFATRRRQ